VSVAGDHLHFINTERKRGGHVLGFETEKEVDIGVAVISKVHLELPTDNSQFNEAALELDGNAIHKVEG
jgi:alpha-acetolactate decarboxylase